MLTFWGYGFSIRGLPAIGTSQHPIEVGAGQHRTGDRLNAGVGKVRLNEPLKIVLGEFTGGAVKRCAGIGEGRHIYNVITLIYSIGADIKQSRRLENS